MRIITQSEACHSESIEESSLVIRFFTLFRMTRTTFLVGVGFHADPQQSIETVGDAAHSIPQIKRGKLRAKLQ